MSIGECERRGGRMDGNVCVLPKNYVPPPQKHSIFVLQNFLSIVFGFVLIAIGAAKTATAVAAPLGIPLGLLGGGLVILGLTGKTSKYLQ